jgi:hypothetical protein
MPYLCFGKSVVILKFNHSGVIFDRLAGVEKNFYAFSSEIDTFYYVFS